MNSPDSTFPVSAFLDTGVCQASGSFSGVAQKELDPGASAAARNEARGGLFSRLAATRTLFVREPQS
jgi:hypothetical protein